MEFQKIAIEKITPPDYNPRKDLQPGDAEYEKLKRSILEFGYVEPIIWNKETGKIVGGNQRFKILKEIGFTEIDCVVIEVNEEKEKALNIALNKIEGEWDEDKLAVLLQDLSIGDIDEELTGFEKDEIKEILQDIIIEQEETAVEDDYEEELPEVPTSKEGEIYKLGRHYLMCGDSTKVDDVKKLMGGESADVLLTDPPYGVDYTGKTKEHLKIENDKMADDELSDFITNAMENASEVLRPGGAFYVWHADSKGNIFRDACTKAGLTVRECLIWVKNVMVMGRQDYQWKHEPCLYGWKDGAAHKWRSDRCQTTVLEFDRPTRNKEHPTMKPVKLFDYQMKNNTDKGDKVLDLFAGSGTTIIAAEQNGRTAYCMEKDPKYVDVIIARWELFTGKKAERVEK